MSAKRQFKSRNLSFESMDQYITITSEDQNPCDFISNFVESVNIADGYEVAIKSIFHAPVYNITEANNKFAVTTQLRARGGERQDIVLDIPTGFYEATCDLMAAIHSAFVREGQGDLVSLKFADRTMTLTFTGNSRKISGVDTNRYFVLNNYEAPLLGIIGYCTHEHANLRDHVKVDRIEVSQYIIENTTEAGFLYSSIVSNSMINQKQSRLLACIPINSRPGYNYYEVKNPVYRPLSVHSFTDIHFLLTDVRGRVLDVTDLPTILLLHIRKIR